MEQFVVKWSTGRISVNINNYFAKANISDIKKFFKICEQHSTEEDRKNLIDDLEKSKIYWAERFDNSYRGALSPTLLNVIPRTVKQLENLLKKLDKAVEYLYISHWGVTRTPVIVPKHWSGWSG